MNSKAVEPGQGWVSLVATSTNALGVDLALSSSAPMRVYVGTESPEPESTVGFVLEKTDPQKTVRLEIGESMWVSAMARRAEVPWDTTTVANSSTVNVSNNQATVQAATILSGQSLSAALDLGTARLARIATPAAWTAANLTFQASYDGVTYNDLYDSSGSEYVVNAAASRSIIIPLADFFGIRFLKVRSGTAAAAVNQAADRTLQLVLAN